MHPAAPSVFRRGGCRSALLLFAFLALGGCRVDALVTIAVDGPGGEVTARFEADEQAVSTVGGPRIVAQGVQAADLRAAGWEVSGPRRTGAGGAVVSATKRFARPADLGPLIEELSGPEGPLRRFRLDRDRGLYRVRYRVSGQAFPGTGEELLTGFGNDPELAGRLRAAGVDPDRVAQVLTERAVDGLRLAVAVDLPGRDPVRVEAGPGKPAEVAVSSSHPDRVRPALLALAGGLAVAALAVLRPRRS